jgi:4'-phosphopantetheinyl transferase
MTPTPPPPLWPLPPDEVHLWYVHAGQPADPAVLAFCRSLLAPGERARHDRFAFDKDRLQYLLGRALVRTTLSRYAAVAPAAWRFAADAHGKPLVQAPQPPLRFNLSHTDGLVACVVAGALDVGVDVENVGRRCDVLGLARSCLAPDEFAHLERLPADCRPDAFFDFWTLKEAYVKARGLGLALPLKDFAFELRDGGQARVRFAVDEDDPARWQFVRLRPTNSHRLAVAVHKPSDRPVTVAVYEAELEAPGEQ